MDVIGTLWRAMMRELLPPTKDVLGKVMFSEASVILSTGEGDVSSLDTNPPGQRVSPGQTTPGQRTPWTEPPR